MSLNIEKMLKYYAISLFDVRHSVVILIVYICGVKCPQGTGSSFN